MEIGSFFKEKKWKKWKKDQWLILLLAGVLLLIVCLPDGTKQKKDTQEKAAVSQTQTAVSVSEYEEKMQERLQEVLEQMDGVGQVRVMITCKDEGESVVEKDATAKESSQTDQDEQGKSQQTIQKEQSEQTVYDAGDQEGEPVIKKQIVPEIEGVVVVAQGGSNTVVVENISEAVQALFPVEAHKIKVVKMNLEEESK